MKTQAISMVLLMIVSALAGCTTGDPDGDGELGIDPDLLDELIESNLQDFINNTTVTVNQEIHYHNNTTVVNNYDETNNEFQNTTNVDGGEVVNNNYDQSETNWNIGGASFGEGVNGSVTGSSMMFVAHIEFTGLDLFPNYQPSEDPQNNDFSYNYTYYDYLTNQERTDLFNYPCSVFYIVGSQSNNSQVSYWEDNNNYYNAWQQMYNSTIAEMLQDAAYSVRGTCDFVMEDPLASGLDDYQHTFFTIDLPEGYAIQYIQLSSNHYAENGCWNSVYDERMIYPYYGCNNADQDQYGSYNETAFWAWPNGTFGQSVWNIDDGIFYGGWANMSLEFEMDMGENNIRECRDINGNTYQDSNGNWEMCKYAQGSMAIWPTSEYVFTLYYRFVPVIPVE